MLRAPSALLSRPGRERICGFSTGEPLEPSLPSTIIDCSGPEPVVLRQGAIPLGRVRCVVPGVHDRK